MSEQTIFQLSGKVQHYAWGGVSFLPNLLGIKNENKIPFAEYWLGIHPKGIATFNENEKPILLNQKAMISYLLKILDVKEMLSIQVHPSKELATIGFEMETLANIPIDATIRNYKDYNHKPEMAIALGEFWLLHGFKTEDKILKIIKSVPAFFSLLSVFEKEGMKGLYNFVMTCSQEKVNEILNPLLARIIPSYQLNKFKKADENYWAAKAALTFNKDENCDRGIFSVYFFNLVCLQKEEGIIQLAGLPHAYLEGQCIEIMANSDNVIRAGLTRKHIDILGLMKILKIEPTIPLIIKGAQSGFETKFSTIVNDFQLSLFKQKVGEDVLIFPKTTEIIFVLKGAVILENESSKIELKQGQSAVLFSGKEVKMTTLEDAEIYKASGSK